MKDLMMKKLAGVVTSVDSGGFTAVASDGLMDRDGEVIAPRALELPASVPVALDHGTSAVNVVARGRPYYVGDELHVDATFDASADAQAVRAKIADGILSALSIVFLGHEWKDLNGVRTCVRGELLGVDIVRYPSNPRSRVLSVRSFNGPSHPAVPQARRHALMALVEVELASARAVLKDTDRRRPYRRQVDELLARSLDWPEKPSEYVSRFLRSL